MSKKDILEMTPKEYKELRIIEFDKLIRDKIKNEVIDDTIFQNKIAFMTKREEMKEQLETVRMKQDDLIKQGEIDKALAAEKEANDLKIKLSFIEDYSDRMGFYNKYTDFYKVNKEMLDKLENITMDYYDEPIKDSPTKLPDIFKMNLEASQL